MITITCFGDRTSGAFRKIIASVSRTDNFVIVNVNVQQCYISSCILLPLRFALLLNNASGL